MRFYAALRKELKETIRKPMTPEAERAALVKKLRGLPRDSNPHRVKGRCLITGRTGGYYRKFGLSPLKLREKAFTGELPGVTKSNW